MRRKRTEEAVIFIGCLFSDPAAFSAALPLLRDRFGETFYESPSVPWHFSDYYATEMGTPLFRNFVFFDPLVDATSLVGAKLATLDVEETLSLDGKRQINLDPGYLTLAKVVLASTKNYSHRIYLGEGVFCELELFYEKGLFNPLPYTYFDYRDRYCLSIFSKARRLLKQKIDGRR